jgi:hypothetical protein
MTTRNKQPFELPNKDERSHPCCHDFSLHLWCYRTCSLVHVEGNHQVWQTAVSCCFLCVVWPKVRSLNWPSQQKMNEGARGAALNNNSKRACIHRSIRRPELFCSSAGIIMGSWLNQNIFLSVRAQADGT